MPRKKTEEQQPIVDGTKEKTIDLIVPTPIKKTRSETKTKDKEINPFMRLWLGRATLGEYEFAYRINGFWSMIRAAFAMLNSHNLLLVENHRIKDAPSDEIEVMAKFAIDPMTRMIILKDMQWKG